MKRPAETLAAHHTWLRRAARGMARSSAAADDLVQDACVTALQNAPEDAEMRPWLRSAMRKLAWGRARADTRRAQREEIFSLNMPPSAGPDPLLRYGVDRARLAQALDTLPEPFRSTVVQRYIEGRSCAEIARAEQVPAGTVRWRQTRALELLRSELEGRQRRGRRARQARIVWLLPALGIQRAAAAVSRDLLALSGHAKLAGLALAGLVVAFGLHLLDGAEHGDERASPDTALAVASGQLVPGGASRTWQQPGQAARARTERLLAAGSAHIPDSRSSHPTRLASSGNANHRQRAARRPRVHGIDPGSHPASRVLEDCWLDERGKLRCHKPPMTPIIPGRPTCDFLNHNVAFIDTTRSTQLMKISHANRFLSAALLANMALAANLGCQLYVDSPDGTGSSGGAHRRDNDPSCVTKEGLNGGVCTTCIDEAGAETTMCAPADCYSETLPDGSLCTTCADEAGNSETVCETPDPQDPEQPAPNCFTYVDAWRFMCTVCDDAWEAECVAAQCSTDGNGCYTCVDENGRTESGCSDNLDCWGYGGSATGAHSFSVCNTNVCPDGTATKTCHYPGPDTCTYSESELARCLSCSYPDGSGTSSCLSDPNDPLPDPLFDRPADLPAPGTCVTEASPGGFWTCTTCTEADGYASSNCSYGAASSCTAERLDDGRTCSRCTYPDGSVTSLCFHIF